MKAVLASSSSRGRPPVAVDAIGRCNTANRYDMCPLDAPAGLMFANGDRYVLLFSLATPHPRCALTPSPVSPSVVAHMRIEATAPGDASPSTFGPLVEHNLVIFREFLEATHTVSLGEVGEGDDAAAAPTQELTGEALCRQLVDGQPQPAAAAAGADPAWPYDDKDTRVPTDAFLSALLAVRPFPLSAKALKEMVAIVCGGGRAVDVDALLDAVKRRPSATRADAASAARYVVDAEELATIEQAARVARTELVALQKRYV